MSRLRASHRRGTHRARRRHHPPRVVQAHVRGLPSRERLKGKAPRRTHQEENDRLVPSGHGEASSRRGGPALTNARWRMRRAALAGTALAPGYLLPSDVRGRAPPAMAATCSCARSDWTLVLERTPLRVPREYRTLLATITARALRPTHQRPPAPIQALLGVFSTSLAGLRLGDVDRQISELSVSNVASAASDLAGAQLALDAA